jgi:hypothetical protein
MVKKQQMRWTERPAHRLLQVRARILNEDLWATFQGWYPGMKSDPELAAEEAAEPPFCSGLLASTTYGTTPERVQPFVEDGGGCRATFFNDRRKLRGDPGKAVQ